ncbi:Uma2 family endonuclease [Kineococcus arenarius]|uniref:Uma2 family endonuclease n=1 Tax=Kineococcus sp. SYSU DK007 TaxID=3383128 RepID=UPI003D7CC418
MAVTTPEAGRPVSWDEYDALPEDPRVEYVDGHLLVSPSPTRWHRELCIDLLTALRTALPPAHRVITAWEWRTGTDAFIPDVMVYDTAAATDERRSTGTPALCVEVLSTNRRDDLLLKTAKHAEAGLPRYWIVDPRERTLSTFALDDGAFRPTHVLRPADGAVELDLGVARLRLDVAALLGP